MAGYESLRVIKRDQLMRNAVELGRYFKESLFGLKEKHEIVAGVRGMGLILGIELGPRGNKALAAKRAERVMQLSFEAGLLMSRVGIYDNTIRVTPPLVVTKAQIDTFIQRMDEILTEI